MTTTTTTQPKLRQWSLSEPVRLYAYSLLLAAIPLAITYGLMTGEVAALWSALGAAALGVPATELVRSAVYSPATTLRLLAKQRAATPAAAPAPAPAVVAVAVPEAAAAVPAAAPAQSYAGADLTESIPRITA